MLPYNLVNKDFLFDSGWGSVPIRRWGSWQRSPRLCLDLVQMG